MIQAEGVYNQRLQNLAVTLDKVTAISLQSFLLYISLFCVFVKCFFPNEGIFEKC